MKGKKMRKLLNKSDMTFEASSGGSKVQNDVVCEESTRKRKRPFNYKNLADLVVKLNNCLDTETDPSSGKRKEEKRKSSSENFETEKLNHDVMDTELRQDESSVNRCQQGHDEINEPCPRKKKKKKDKRKSSSENFDIGEMNHDVKESRQEELSVREGEQVDNEINEPCPRKKKKKKDKRKCSSENFDIGEMNHDVKESRQEELSVRESEQVDNEINKPCPRKKKKKKDKRKSSSEHSEIRELNHDVMDAELRQDELSVGKNEQVDYEFTEPSQRKKKKKKDKRKSSSEHSEIKELDHDVMDMELRQDQSSVNKCQQGHDEISEPSPRQKKKKKDKRKSSSAHSEIQELNHNVMDIEFRQNESSVSNSQQDHHEISEPSLRKKKKKKDKRKSSSEHSEIQELDHDVMDIEFRQDESSVNKCQQDHHEISEPSLRKKKKKKDKRKSSSEHSEIQELDHDVMDMELRQDGSSVNKCQQGHDEISEPSPRQKKKKKDKRKSSSENFDIGEMNNDVEESRQNELSVGEDEQVNDEMGLASQGKKKRHKTKSSSEGNEHKEIEDEATSSPSCENNNVSDGKDLITDDKICATTPIQLERVNNDGVESRLDELSVSRSKEIDSKPMKKSKFPSDKVSSKSKVEDVLDDYSELHSWELNYNPLKAKQDMESRGFTIEYGKWSKKECDILDRNVKSFCKVARIDLDKLRKMLFDDSPVARETRKEIGLYQKLAKGIKRPIAVIYYKLRQFYNPDNYKGKFSEEELKRLVALHKKYGNSWKIIGEHMGRSSLSCLRKYRRICPFGDDAKKGDVIDSVKHGRWLEDEVERLKSAVQQLFGNENDSSKIHWGPVSAIVKTRNSEQCRRKWLLKLSLKDTGVKAKKWSKLDDAKMIKALSKLGVEADKSVNWEVVSDAIGRPIPTATLKEKWFLLKASVPDYHSLEMVQLLAWLKKEFEWYEF